MGEAVSLSILLITQGDVAVRPCVFHTTTLAAALGAELVVAHDRRPKGYVRMQVLRKGVCIRTDTSMTNPKHGCLEQLHGMALTHCTGDYILRLDDDERCSPAMVQWLKDRRYEARDHWSFARAHLWLDEMQMLTEYPYWPDCQTRLSVKAKAGGRDTVHVASPFGYGTLAPAVIEHHNFLVKSPEERRAQADRYEAIKAGSGSGPLRTLQVPEDTGVMQSVAPLWDGWLPMLPPIRDPWPSMVEIL